MMQDRAEGEDRISACILYLHTPWASFSKTSARYRVPGIGYLAPGTWYPAPEPVRRRGPNTDHRRPSLATGKRAHQVCISNLNKA